MQPPAEATGIQAERTEQVLGTSDILSDITPGKSENSGEQTKTAATNGRWQIADSVALQRNCACLLGFLDLA
jgi:hypothetical protein